MSQDKSESEIYAQGNASFPPCVPQGSGREDVGSVSMPIQYWSFWSYKCVGFATQRTQLYVQFHHLISYGQPSSHYSLSLPISTELDMQLHHTPFPIP